MKKLFIGFVYLFGHLLCSTFLVASPEVHEAQAAFQYFHRAFGRCVFKKMASVMFGIVAGRPHRS